MEVTSDEEVTTDSDDPSEAESGSNAEDIGAQHRSKPHKHKHKKGKGKHTRAPRNSKGRRQVMFTQLQAYPGQWLSILEDAKKQNCGTIALESGFPDCWAGLKEAEDCLLEAMAAHEAEDGVVEEGMCKLFILQLQAEHIHIPTRILSRTQSWYESTGACTAISYELYLSTCL